MKPEREVVIAVAAVIYAGRLASGIPHMIPRVYSDSVADALYLIAEADRQIAALPDVPNDASQGETAP